MSPDNSAFILVRATFIFLAILTIIDLARQRDRIRLEIALTFIALALIFWQITVTPDHSPAWLGIASSIAVVAQPFLSLQLVSHFRPVPGVVRYFAVLGMVASLGILLAIPAPRSVLLLLIAVGYFVAVQGYCAFAFVIGTVSTLGVTRWRLAFAAAGSAMLTLIIVLLAMISAMQSVSPLAAPVGVLLMVLSAVCYYLGFAPPRWLRRTWQLLELESFLTENTSSALKEFAADTLGLLCAYTERTVGAVAVVAMCAADGSHLVIQAPHTSPLLNTRLEFQEAELARLWQNRLPQFVASPASVGDAVAAVANKQKARALLMVPVAAEKQVRGLLIVFLQRRPLFVNDVLQLLAVLSTQSAIMLNLSAVLAEAQALNEQLEQRVRERTQELESANQALDTFAHTVAHEVKSPITQIVGYAQMGESEIARADPSSPLVVYFSQIVRGARKMGNIIDGLLLLANTRQSQASLTALDMGTVFADACHRLHHDIKSSQVSISTPGEWLPCMAYAPWVEEIWVNYIGNAIKYAGERANIDVRCELISGSMVRYSVRDNGPGISPEDQQRLFVPFVRLGNSKKHGHGLGLSIVRQIVEKCGGKAGVVSQPGQGACFWFTLPKA